MRKKIITLFLLGTALEVAWLYGGLEILRGKSGFGLVGRIKQEVEQVKTLVEKATEALKAEQGSLGVGSLAGSPPAPGDPSRNPFALPQGVRLLAQPSGTETPGEAGAEKEAAKAAPPPARELNGILVGPRDRVAIIDGTLVRAGDSLQGERVIDVRRDHVVLARDGQRRTLHLPPPFPESKPGTEQLEISSSTGEPSPKRSNGAERP